MCGIAGVLALEKNMECNPYLLTKMNEAMRHRGPDGTGTWVSDDKQVALAHTRLSIIDLSDLAAQPMQSEDGALVLSFNGEIYNHAEIRKEIEDSESFSWKTDHSDTEVILQAYRKWGIECVHKFRGMFAFALWDGSKRIFWLVRDRMGIKPLYWTENGGKLYFASEIKAILQEESIPRRMNRDSVYHYLTFLCSPAPQTLFQGIYKVPAGGLLRIDDSGNILQQQWYELLHGIKKDHKKNEEDWADEIRDKLSESVRYRMESDVPVGVFLSGGIDSSTNASLFNQYSEGRRIKTFTIGFENSESYPNEFKFARKMAQEINAEHFERILTKEDLLGFLDEMVYFQDEPIADPVCFPVYFISQLAKENGVTVCQVGEGADELFWGYQSWKTMLYLQKLNDFFSPRWIKQIALDMGEKFFSKKLRSLELLKRGAQNERIFWNGCDEIGERQKNRLWSGNVQTSYSVIGDLFLSYINNSDEFSDLDWMAYVELKLRLPELLLMRVDKMGMANSLEARVPFLDHQFVELAFSIPERIKTQGGLLKNILKKAVRGVIPDSLIDRKKQGFGVPLQDWMVANFDNKIKSVVTEFNQEVVLFDSLELEKILYGRAVSHKWILFNLALWWEKYLK